MNIIVLSVFLLFLGYGFSYSFMDDSSEKIRIMLLLPYGGIVFAMGCMIAIIVMVIWNIAILPVSVFKKYKNSTIKGDS